jgi:hypothetical protein
MGWLDTKEGQRGLAAWKEDRAPLHEAMARPNPSLFEIPSQCSYCREEGLSEGQCSRGDCYDGCGDCAELGDLSAEREFGLL